MAEKLLEICNSEENTDEELLRQYLKRPDIKIDHTDGDGMTSLMHAAYKGKAQVCRILVEHGADINSNAHAQGYTALMFATIAGHRDIVEFLLKSGARPDVENGIGKTAAQMGGFVGQHDCVRLINNFFPISELEHYAEPQGLESVAKLDKSAVSPLYSYIMTDIIHPVKLILLLKTPNSPLLEHHKSVVSVLCLLSDKAIKENEVFALKLHYLSYTLRKCAAAENIDDILTTFLTMTDTGVSLGAERFLRQCLKEYPHVHSVLLKQLVKALTDIPLGASPTTLSLFTSSLIGNRGSQHLKKCSKCEKALYCGADCQRLAWTVGNHRKLCKKWTKAKLN